MTGSKHYHELRVKLISGSQIFDTRTISFHIFNVRIKVFQEVFPQFVDTLLLLNVGIQAPD
jgi:hypothetical protein